MPSKGKTDSKAKKTTASATDHHTLVVNSLRDLYENKLLPIEKKYLFHKFHGPELLPSELSAKPLVLLLGQYSVGKTSFIRHLIGNDYPGMHIGPEPTTDKFIAVVDGEEGKIIKGNSLTAVDNLPFAGLSSFGVNFLNKFEAALVSSPLLKDVTIIDTPGVLSGEKQRLSRGYDFAQVSKWFAERADLILLLFDSYKLDVSDEFKDVIEHLKQHDDKVHCILNKADQLDSESLMRVYGALLWSMGKIVSGAEVPRVYVGSFTEKPTTREELRPIFERDQEALMGHLHDLPKSSGMRKVNEMVKRIRLNIVHVCIMGKLRSKMPLFFNREGTQKKLIAMLPEIFSEVRFQYNLSEGDFPPVDDFRAALQLQDFSTFPKADRDTLNTLKDLLTVEIPDIFKNIAGIDSDNNSSLSPAEEVIANKSLKNTMNYNFDVAEKRELGGLMIAVAVLFAVLAIAVAILADNGQLVQSKLVQLKSALRAMLN